MTEQIGLALLAISSVAILVLSHYLIRKLGRKIGGQIGRTLGRLLRPVFTLYYRRKVVKQMQADRKAKGLPPIENPYT
jgi:hypothetical protein